jgi:hypothetical protein
MRKLLSTAALVGAGVLLGRFVMRTRISRTRTGLPVPFDTVD